MIKLLGHCVIPFGFRQGKILHTGDTESLGQCGQQHQDLFPLALTKQKVLKNRFKYLRMVYILGFFLYKYLGALTWIHPNIRDITKPYLLLLGTIVGGRVGYLAWQEFCCAWLELVCHECLGKSGIWTSFDGEL